MENQRFNIIEFMNSQQAKHEYTKEQSEEVYQLVQDAICECLRVLYPSSNPIVVNGDLLPWGMPANDDEDDE